MSKTNKVTGFKKRELLWIIVIILALYVIIPQFKSFKSSWHLIAHPNAGYLVLAACFMLLTYFAAAATYCLLSVRKLSYVEELIVQPASMFVNRLLPAGIGGIGANYEYLKKKGHTSNEAATLVAANNSLGVIGHFSIIIVALLLSSGAVLPHVGYKGGLKRTIAVIAFALLFMIVIGIAFSLRRVKRAASAFLRQLVSYTHKPVTLLFAYLSQVALSLSNIFCLYYSAHAVGIRLSFLAVLLIFTFGSGIRTVVPTPGGIGGFEAGLVAGFVAYKIPSAEALAAVLLFRIISYWAPLILGSISFIYVEGRNWFAVTATA